MLPQDHHLESRLGKVIIVGPFQASHLSLFITNTRIAPFNLPRLAKETLQKAGPSAT